MQLSESQVGQIDGTVKNSQELDKGYAGLVKKPNQLLVGLNYPQIMVVTQNS